MQTDIDEAYVFDIDDEGECLVLDETMALLRSQAISVPSELVPVRTPITEAPKRGREEPVHADEEDERDAYASVQTDSGDKTTKNKKSRATRFSEEDGDDGEASSTKVGANFFLRSLFLPLSHLF